mmetsp:Transcript_32080/g.89803  ORF Transcript_32080/g.89803 Transcript_32080/m.89803 type:complete len:290 (-) Transcript_32080:175-1044(-)
MGHGIPERSVHIFSFPIMLNAIVIVLFLANGALTAVPESQIEALQDLYKLTDGPNWKNNTNWLTGDPCSRGWFGVTCNAFNTTIITLSLSTNSLNGIIPSSIGQLSSLSSLALDSNLLTGSIPDALGDILYVRNLFLQNNSLAGSIPASFGNMYLLRVLWLFSNTLSGSIPEALGNLSSLRSLLLSSNSLTGSIPEVLDNLTSLRRLMLSSNSLTGSLSNTLVSLSKLRALFVDSNELTGFIPDGICQLRDFNVSENDFDCPHPACCTLESCGPCSQFTKLTNLVSPLA